MKPTIKIEFDPYMCDFPEPFTDEWEGPFDLISCIHYAAIYEKWADKARACGRNDLAVEYEAASAYWNKDLDDC